MLYDVLHHPRTFCIDNVENKLTTNQSLFTNLLRYLYSTYYRKDISVKTRKFTMQKLKKKSL